MTQYKSKNRHKYLLQYHVIFVCKYRKPLLSNKQISDYIKILSREICVKNNITVKYMETDKDYIHYMIEAYPTLSISKIVKLIKSYTTYYIWKKYNNYLIHFYWKENTFWTDGYFASTIGNVSEKTIKEYIENQG